MPNIYGQLSSAQLEVLATAPTNLAKARVYYDSVLLKAYLSDGSILRPFLINDAYLAVGNSGTAASNVRLNRCAAAQLQLLIGGDTTAEGSVQSTQASWGALLAKLGGSLVNTPLVYSQISTPSSPTSGENLLYFKNDDSVYIKNSAGVETLLGGTTPIFNARNFLLNGDFYFWQRYGASPSQTIANTVSTYVADRWYGKNSLGTNGVLTVSQVTGATGSLFGCSVKVSTAPTAAQTNGCELYQTITNFDSIPLYGQNACFGVLIKSLGNVTSVGIQFFYKTTEAKVDTSIGSEVVTTVNTSTFVACTISGQALGITQTTSGVIGVRIRISGVSSGNTYDINNGFIASQAIVNLGTTLASFTAGGNLVQQLKSLQLFYETTSPNGTAPGTGGAGFIIQLPALASSANNQPLMGISFLTEKRASPTVTIYSDNGTTGKISNFESGSDVTVGSGAVTNNGLRGFAIFNKTGGTITAAGSDGYCVHYSADAEI